MGIFAFLGLLLVLFGVYEIFLGALFFGIIVILVGIFLAGGFGGVGSGRWRL